MSARFKKSAGSSSNLTTFSQSVANRLRETLKQRGISAAQLSARSGVSKSAISTAMSINSPRIPNAYTLHLIANALQVSIDDLLGQEATRPDAKPENVFQYFPNAFNAENNLYERVALSDPDAFKLYVCDTLPELVKTTAVLQCEMGMRAELSDYAQRMDVLLAQMEQARSAGMYLCDISIIEQLVNRCGIYAKLSQKDLDAQLARLSTFNARFFPKATGYVVDFRKHGLSSCYLYGDDKIIMFQFDGYFAFSSQTLTDDLKARIREAVKNAPTVDSFIEGLLARAQ